MYHLCLDSLDKHAHCLDKLTATHMISVCVCVSVCRRSTVKRWCYCAATWWWSTWVWNWDLRSNSVITSRDSSKANSEHRNTHTHIPRAEGLMGNHCVTHYTAGWQLCERLWRHECMWCRNPPPDSRLWTHYGPITAVKVWVWRLFVSTSPWCHHPAPQGLWYHSKSAFWFVLETPSRLCN